MTDNTSLVHNHRGVSSGVLYNLKPSCVNGRSYRCSIPPTKGSSFAPSSIKIFYIPARRNYFLDPQNTYLRLTVKNNDTTSGQFFLDACGACFIQRIDIYSGSNLVKTTQAYNVLMNTILDLNMNFATRVGASEMYGTADILGNAFAPRQECQIISGDKLTYASR